MEEKMNNRSFFSSVWNGLKIAGKWILDFFRKNTLLKLVSLLFAVFVWAFVIVEENPQRTMTLRDVPVTYSGIDSLTKQGLTVETDDLLKQVDIVMLAGQDTHKSINTNNVRAFIDFSTINGIGSYTLDVQTAVSIGGVSVQRISTNKVNVTVEALATRKVPVTYEITGEPEEGYYIAEPVLDSSIVSITGKASSVNTVTHAVCEISVSGLTQTTDKSYNLKLIDNKGREVDISSVNSEIPSAVVHLEVSRVKEVSLDTTDLANRIKGIKSGFEITGATANPATFEIIGSEEALEKVTTLRIKPMNVENIDSSTLINAEIEHVEGVTVLSGEHVSIYLQISEISAEKKFENIKINYINAAEGLTAELSDNYTNVTMVGGVAQLEKLSREDIVLYVDLADLSAGTITLPVRIEEIVGIDVTKAVIETPTISVTLR